VVVTAAVHLKTKSATFFAFLSNRQAYRKTGGVPSGSNNLSLELTAKGTPALPLGALPFTAAAQLCVI